MRQDGRVLRGVVLAVVGLGLIAPIALGFWQTARAAFGILPAMGFDKAALEPWRLLIGQPGFATSLRLTLVTGIGSTVLSLILATGFCARMHGRMPVARAGRWLAPFLAVPHAAMAVGLAFLLAPSGWIARVLAPLAGWRAPPDLASVGDGWGLALMLGLLVKEVPFLLLVMLSALGQLPVAAQMAAGRALGYGRGLVWLKVIMPQVWPLIRLPVWVVLAYALSVVDMAMILGPSHPPTLAEAVTRLYAQADPVMILPASAGALLQAGIVVAAVLAALAAEWGVAGLGLWWLRRGGRGVSAEPGLWLASVAVMVLMLLATLAMLALMLWSFAWRWPFPALVPEIWSLQSWQDGAAGLRAALLQTLLLAGSTVALSLALAIAWLEGEDRGQLPRAPWAEALIYLPLILPQIGFLYGLNVVFLQMGLSGGFAAVVWAQALIVFPYVMIALSDPWRALDGRIVAAAAAMGAAPWRRLWAVKLPMLLRPILTAAAVGVAVSVAQYLPTLFMGAGRIATLTTEAVTLSSGSDRRITGTYASLQAALPFAAYLLAFVIPGLAQRHRRGLTEAGA